MSGERTVISLILWVLVSGCTCTDQNATVPFSYGQITPVTKKGRRPASLSRHLFSTKVVERWFSILSQPPVLKQRGEWKKGAGTEKKSDNGSRRKRWSAGSRVPLGSIKVFPLMSNKPKWRRAECSVAIDDDRHICRRKPIMK